MSFKDIPPGMIPEIALNLKYSDILSLCQVSKENMLFQDNQFWIMKIDRDYGFLPDFKRFYNKRATPRESYLFVATFYGKEVYCGTEINEGASNLLKIAAQNNNEVLVDYFLEKGGNVDWGLKGAVSGNNYRLMKKLLKKNPYDITSALQKAAENNNERMIKSLLRYKNSLEKSHILLGAAKGGNIKLVSKYLKYNDGLDLILYIAAKKNHLNIVDYIINNGDFQRGLYIFPEIALQDRDNGIYGAAQSGNIEMVEYILNNIFDNNDDENMQEGVDEALKGAFRSGNKEFIDLFLNKGGRKSIDLIPEIGLGGNLDLLMNIIDEVKNKVDQSELMIDIRIALCNACRKNHFDIVKFLIDEYVGYKDLSSFCAVAAKSGNLYILNFLLSKNSDRKAIESSFLSACSGGHLDIVKMLMKEDIETKIINKAIKAVENKRESIESFLKEKSVL